MSGPESADDAGGRGQQPDAGTQQHHHHQSTHPPERYVEPSCSKATILSTSRTHRGYDTEDITNGSFRNIPSDYCRSAPFQSQLEYLQQQQVPQTFDMRAMGGALPYASQDPLQGMQSPSQYQSAQQAMYLQQQRPQFADPTMLARAQQQQFMGGPQYGGPSPIQRQAGYPMQPQIPFSPMDPYGFAMSPISPMAPGFTPHQQFMMPPGMAPDLCKALACFAQPYNH